MRNEIDDRISRIFETMRLRRLYLPSFCSFLASFFFLSAMKAVPFQRQNPQPRPSPRPTLGTKRIELFLSPFCLPSFSRRPRSDPFHMFQRTFHSRVSTPVPPLPPIGLGFQFAQSERGREDAAGESKEAAATKEDGREICRSFNARPQESRQAAHSGYVGSCSFPTANCHCSEWAQIKKVLPPSLHCTGRPRHSVHKTSTLLRTIWRAEMQVLSLERFLFTAMWPHSLSKLCDQKARWK